LAENRGFLADRTRSRFSVASVCCLSSVT